jgi:hypothetical protein
MIFDGQIKNMSEVNRDWINRNCDITSETVLK